MLFLSFSSLKYFCYLICTCITSILFLCLFFSKATPLVLLCLESQSSCGYTSYSNYSFVHLQESCKKASIICPESEVEALGGCGSRTPDQLSAQLSRLSQRLQNEAQRCALAVPCLFFLKCGGFVMVYSFFLGRHTDSIDDLRELYDQKERKIKRKRIMYNTFRDKLGVSFFNTSRI